MSKLRASILLVSVLVSCSKRPAEHIQKVDVAIIGGGAAGLSAAHTLHKAGLHVQVLEERNVWGGRVQTATYAPGQTGEYGMQELWTDSPLLNIARELNVPVDSTGENAFSSVVLDGKVQWFHGETTTSYFEGLFDANTRAVVDAWRTHAEALYHAALTRGLTDPNVQHLQDISLLQWLREAQLPPRAQAWARALLEVEMATDANDTSALATLLDMEMFFGDGMTTHHIHGGNSVLMQAIAASLKSAATLDAQVTAVRKLAHGAFEVRYEQDHIVRNVHAKRVVVAVPWWRLHQLSFEPMLPGEVWSAVTSLRFGQYTVVHFLTDAGARALWTQDGVTPFPVLAGPLLGGIYGPMPQGRADAGDVFSILLFGASAKTFHMLPRDVKILEVKNEVDALWPGFASHVKDTFVYSYHPTSLPVWPLGRSSIDDLANRLRTSHDGVYLVGDYTRGAHATSAARSGIEAADAIVRELLRNR